MPKRWTTSRTRQQRRAAFEQSSSEYRTLPPVTEDGVQIRLEANIEISRRRDARPGTRRGRHWIVSIGVPAGGGRTGGADRGHTVPRPTAAWSRAWRLRAGSRSGRLTSARRSCGSITPGSEATRAPLGLRGIRLSLALDEMFQAQLRALLRAAAHGPLRIMFPFVSGLEELRAAREAVGRAAETLRARGSAPGAVPIGVMIEVPVGGADRGHPRRARRISSASAPTISIQYCLAVDRTDDRVSSLYEPLHPAILRTLRLVARAGRRARHPGHVCGEMASDPALLTLLVGLGLREFSMAPSALPLAKQVLRGLRAADARQAARRALRARPRAKSRSRIEPRCWRRSRSPSAEAGQEPPDSPERRTGRTGADVSVDVKRGGQAVGLRAALGARRTVTSAR